MKFMLDFPTDARTKGRQLNSGLRIPTGPVIKVYYFKVGIQN